VQAHSAEGKTSVTRSNMSNNSTLLPKAEPITPTEPSVKHISIESKFSALIDCTTLDHNPTAGPRFHAGSFIGGMMLAFIIILVVTLGYRLACSQREVRYRVNWQHDWV
uniref:Uncharacterized protein n=1 Tax=Cyprinus carpio TaxID=7962 RepID=A0A8C1SAB7_CYPCA